MPLWSEDEASSERLEVKRARRGHFGLCPPTSTYVDPSNSSGPSYHPVEAERGLSATLLSLPPSLFARFVRLRLQLGPLAHRAYLPAGSSPHSRPNATDRNAVKFLIGYSTARLRIHFDDVMEEERRRGDGWDLGEGSRSRWLEAVFDVGGGELLLFQDPWEAQGERSRAVHQRRGLAQVEGERGAGREETKGAKLRLVSITYPYFKGSFCC